MSIEYHSFKPFKSSTESYVTQNILLNRQLLSSSYFDMQSPAKNTKQSLGVWQPIKSIYFTLDTLNIFIQ